MPEAPLQRRRAHERPLHRHLLVQQHADEQRQAVGVEEVVGRGVVAGDVQGSCSHGPDATELARARRRLACPRGAVDRHALPERGGDARDLRHQGSPLPGLVGRRRRDHRRRQRLDRRVGARWPAGSACSVVEVPEQGYGAALDGRHPGRARHLRVMGDADDSYDFSALEPFMTALRERRRPGDGRPVRGRHRRRRHARAAPLRRQPRAVVPRPAVLPHGHPRLPLRAARLPP